MVSRDPHSHEVFVRIVRGEVVEQTDPHSPADLPPHPSEKLGDVRFAGPLEDPADRPGALARTTLIGYMLGEGSRFISHSAHGRRSSAGELRVESRVRFSFSRADGYAACAVSGGDPVGVAIESVRRIGPDPLGVSAAVCSDEEREVLAATPALGRPWRLLVMWTLKEAIAKAVGLGHRFPLQRITVGDTGGISTRMLDSLGGPRPSQWNFATWRPTLLHVVAVAVRSMPGTRVRFGGDLAGTPNGVSPDATVMPPSFHVQTWMTSPPE